MNNSFAYFYKQDPEATIPKRAEDGSAGYDVCTLKAFGLYPGERAVVETGLVVQPPEGYHTEILVRSSMAYKYNIILINSVGLIDRSYAGENDTLKIMLYRLPIAGHVDSFTKRVDFEAGDRIAQLVFRKTELFEPVEVFEAPGNNRGGLGSTGK